MRRCLLDKKRGLPWDDILPYVALGHIISKQKSTGYSPYFFLYGRQPSFSSPIRHLEEEGLDIDPNKHKKFQWELAHRGAVLQQVMPLATRNIAITQQRDKKRFRLVRGGGYDKPKAKFVLGEYVLLKQSKANTLQPPVTPQILRITELKESRVVVLQGRDGATLTRQVS